MTDLDANASEFAAIAHFGARDAVAEALGSGGDWRYYVGNDTYDCEPTSNSAAPIVFVRASDGARFQVDVTVSVLPVAAPDPHTGRSA